MSIILAPAMCKFSLKSKHPVTTRSRESREERETTLRACPESWALDVFTRLRKGTPMEFYVNLLLRFHSRETPPADSVPLQLLQNKGSPILTIVHLVQAEDNPEHWSIFYAGGSCTRTVRSREIVQAEMSLTFSPCCGQVVTQLDVSSTPKHKKAPLSRAGLC
jgi:hypothetical protein